MLVKDCLTRERRRLAAKMLNSGKKLTTIFVSHSHGRCCPRQPLSPPTACGSAPTPAGSPGSPGRDEMGFTWAC